MSKRGESIAQELAITSAAAELTLSAAFFERVLQKCGYDILIKSVEFEHNGKRVTDVVSITTTTGVKINRKGS